MGVIHYVTCTDCREAQELGEFDSLIDLLAWKDGDPIAGLAIRAGHSLRVGLFVRFVQEHNGHRILLTNDHATDVCEVMSAIAHWAKDGASTPVGAARYRVRCFSDRTWYPEGEW